MVAYNHVMLVGNLVADVVVRWLPSGVGMADLRLAVSEKFKNKSGESVEKALFVDSEEFPDLPARIPAWPVLTASADSPARRTRR